MESIDMYVKLFYNFNLQNMQEAMNEFLDRIENDEDIVRVSLDVAATREQVQEQDYHHFVGLIAYKGNIVEE